MSTKKRHAIGVLLGNTGQFTQDLRLGITKASAHYDTDLFFFFPTSYFTEHRTDQKKLETLAGTLSLIEANSIDALIINTCVSDFVDREILDRFITKHSNLSIVTISVPVAGAKRIVVDNRQGITASFNHLYHQHNKTRIAYIGGPEENYEAQERYLAYKDSLRANDLSYDPKIVYHGDWFQGSGTQAILTFLDTQAIRFDAVIAASDQMLVGAKEELQRRGYHIPHDISMVGFDDSIYAQAHSFTSIRQPFFEMGKQAVLAALQGNFSEAHRTIKVRPTLITRSSCGCRGDLWSIMPSLPQTQLEQEDAKVFPHNLLKKEDELVLQLKPFFKRRTEAEDLFAISIREIMQLEQTDEHIELSSEHLIDYFIQRIQLAESTVDSILKWQQVIVILHQFFTKYVPTGSTLQYLEKQLHQSHLLVGTAIERLGKIQRIHAEYETYDFSVLGQRLMASFDVVEIADLFQEELPFLAIKQCYLALYKTVLQTPSVDETVEIIAAYTIEGVDDNISPLTNQTTSNTQKIFQQALFSTQKRSEWVVMPLGIFDQSYGYLLLELLAGETHRHLYRPLQLYLSHALQNIHTIAQIRTSQQLAERANQAKSQFLANMGHELRTPLNAVLGAAKLFRNTSLSGSQTEYLEIIENGSELLYNLINDILNFSTVEAGGLKVESQGFDLQHLLSTIMQLFENQAKNQGLDLILELDSMIPNQFFGDVNHIRQLLINLLNNAFKFTESGSIKFGVELGRLGINQHGDEKSELCFYVRDTGIGIAPEKQEQIFQVFTQIDNSTTREYGGLGLGLIMCKYLCAAMGGQIAIESIEGRGSTFRCTIPVSVYHESSLDQQNRQISTDSQAAGRAYRHSLKILIAEDNRINQKVITNILKKLGYQADVAENGRKAVEAATQTSYQLIFMDLHMPEMDGFEATRQIIQKLPPITCPRIVALTASTTEEDRQKATLVGMSDYITKPIRVNELTEVLQEVV